MPAVPAAPCPVSGIVHARRLCTSEECPMAQILESMPHLCEPEPPRAQQPALTDEDRAALARFEAVRPYGDSVWGPAAWTALQADILSLPRELDTHEFCMFKVYLALRARYLPCGACALHFEKALRQMPNHASMRTRAGLLRWITTVQNDVNRRKQREPLDQDAVIAALDAKAAAAAGGEQGGEADGEAAEQGGNRGAIAAAAEAGQAATRRFVGAHVFAIALVIAAAVAAFAAVSSSQRRTRSSRTTKKR